MKSNVKIKLLCILIASLVGVFFAFRYLVPLFAPFILAYFFAWILMPFVQFLHKKVKLPKLLSAIITLIVFSITFIWIIASLVNIFISQSLVFLKNLPIYIAQIAIKIEGLCSGCDSLFGMEIGTAKGVFDSNMDNVLTMVKTTVIPSLTSKSLTIAIGLVEIVGIILVILVTTLLLLKDKTIYLDSLRNSIFYQEIRVVTSRLSVTGIAYLKTQAIIMLLVSATCSVALFFIQNKYALLIGMGIGIFDSFPLLGSGIILVPWALFELFNQNVKNAAILISLFVVCQIIRQFLEPKLLGNRIGVLPVYTLMSMYVGLRIFGFTGFFLGPIALIVVIAIMTETRLRFANTNIKEE